MRILKVVCPCLLLAATAAAQNLLTNGSFNGTLNSWDVVSWTTFDPTLDATGSPGSGSAKILVPAGGGGTAFSQCVAITGSRLYKAGGKILIPSGQAVTGWGAARVRFFSDSDCSESILAYGTSSYVTTDGSWISTDTGFVLAPPGSESAEVRLNVGNNGGAGSPALQINADDMFLTADGVSFQRWIPAVIHKDVASKNAKWRSDVAVLNRSLTTANLTITMYPPSGPVSQTMQVGGASQLLLSDVAGSLGVTADSGPLEVASDQDFFLSGRTYNQADATHTFGQDYDGEDFSELLAAGESGSSVAWLPQLTESGQYRTNIGITNTGNAWATVTLTLYDSSGVQVWEETRDYAPFGFYQYQQPYSRVGGIANGYARVTVNAGAGVVAYASVIDNSTDDPTTITMKR